MSIFVKVFILLCGTICTSNSESKENPRCTGQDSQNASTPTLPVGWYCYDEEKGKKCYPKNYYYDRQHDTCREFEYKGCGGNRNNFVSSFECISHCRKNSPDLRNGKSKNPWINRMLEKIPPCEKMTFNPKNDSGGITRFFYNIKNKTCEEVLVKNGDVFYPALSYCMSRCNATGARTPRCDDGLETGTLPLGWNCKNETSRKFVYRVCEKNETNRLT